MWEGQESRRDLFLLLLGCCVMFLEASAEVLGKYIISKSAQLLCGFLVQVRAKYNHKT